MYIYILDIVKAVVVDVYKRQDGMVYLLFDRMGGCFDIYMTHNSK